MAAGSGGHARLCRLHKRRERSFGRQCIQYASARRWNHSPASRLSTGSTLPTGADPVNLDPADFSADITNPYWPMKPGTRWTYRNVERRASLRRTSSSSPRRPPRSWPTASQRGWFVIRPEQRPDLEDTVDWYAQDADGNVWYMGEKTAEFENGKIDTREGSWEAGKDGAMPGIMLPAQPQVGQKYRQEYKKGEAEDNGEVLATQPSGRGRGRTLQRRAW